MPTYEAAAAIIRAVAVAAATRHDRLLGGIPAALAVTTGLLATLVWRLYFGGPVIALGALAGLGLGLAMHRRTTSDVP